MGIKAFFNSLIGKDAPEISSVQVRNSKYGWKPDYPDQRDLICTLPNDLAVSQFPPYVDLVTTGLMPAIYDQGRLGSCTANSIAAGLEYDRAKQGLPVWTPSRLFIYYFERVAEGTVTVDAGAMIRDGFKVINQVGYAKESTWPYVIPRFATRPSEAALAEAKEFKAIKYQRVDQTANALKGILFHGHPISFGISVYASFETMQVARTGIVPMPTLEERRLGGHAILLVGYDDAKQMFKFRNSWGTTWGDKGYGYLPYEYVLNPRLASDFWISITLNY